MDLIFALLIIVEGCVGPSVVNQTNVCVAQNFGLRIVYESLDECEKAKKGIITLPGDEKYFKLMCIATPKIK
jgi:hypothetical protein